MYHPIHHLMNWRVIQLSESIILKQISITHKLLEYVCVVLGSNWPFSIWPEMGNYTYDMDMLSIWLGYNWTDRPTSGRTYGWVPMQHRFCLDGCSVWQSITNVVPMVSPVHWQCRWWVYDDRRRRPLSKCLFKMKL